MRRGRHLGVLTVVLAACANTPQFSTVSPTVAAPTTNVVMGVEPTTTVSSPSVVVGEIAPSTTTFAGLLEGQGADTEAIRPAEVPAPTDPPPPPESAPVEEEPESIPDLIRRRWLEDGWPAWAANEAVRVARCESQHNPLAHNDVLPDNSYGLFQINVRPNAQGPRVRAMGLTPDDLFDPNTNIDVALAIYRESRWRLWSCKP